MPIETLVETDDEVRQEGPKSKFSIYTKDERYKKREAKVLMEGGILIVALLFGLIMRVYAYEGAYITSGSMIPTMRKGDYVLVDHRPALRGQWKRGEVILFKAPPSWDSAGQTLVKRVIGLPGETVGIYIGVVQINGKPLPEKYVPKEIDAETIPTVTLGANEYFVLGDNRDHSDDSRDNGPITESDIRGKAITKLWPASQVGAFLLPRY